MSNPAVSLRPDRLLQGTRLLLMFAMAIAVVVAIGLVIAIPSVWVFADEIFAAAAREKVRLSGNDSLVVITVILVGAIALMGLVIQFLRKLVALIDSVGQGSPFIPENAARLRTMGWIVLAMQGLALLAMPLAVWIRETLPDGHVVFSLSLEGLITALLLFILARVFDHGTRLAEDVEGTV